jgi:phosphoserine phosphatase RsbU/P
MSSTAQPGFDTDLELASRVQRGLLPKASCCMAAWEIAFSYEAARHVSGDYLDLVEMGRDSFYFILGDVSGKGVAAALLMAHLHATVRMLLASGHSLDQIIKETSSTFCQSSLPAQFATLVIGEANRAGNIKLINAGQTPVLFAHDHSTKVLPATQVPLGLFCGLEADPVSTTVHEQAVPDDILLLYSDGVTETIGEDGSEYGIERLRDLLSRTALDGPEETIAAVSTDVRSFSPNSELSDDRSLMALHYRGA